MTAAYNSGGEDGLEEYLKTIGLSEEKKKALVNNWKKTLT